MQPHLPDDVSVRRWFALYGAYFLLLGIPLVALVYREDWSWSDWWSRPKETFGQLKVTLVQLQEAFGQMSPAIKLLAMGLYLSLACTFLPLPTGWIVAGVAMREMAVGGDVWSTTLIVAGISAVASTIANLNDYHLFTWMLRHHRIAAVRNTRTYLAASRWFARSPFFLLVVFNFIPIPIDFVRMLATTYRYPRVPFAAANLLGRFVRYGIIAFVTYWWNLGWIAPAVLLALAVVLGMMRIGPKLMRTIFARSSKDPTRIA